MLGSGFLEKEKNMKEMGEKREGSMFKAQGRI